MIMVATGNCYSESQISQWESESRRIYANQLRDLCYGLKVSPYRLLGIDYEGEEDEVLHDIIRCIPEDEKEIYRYMYCEWNGNPRALTKFLAMYMALPPSLRQDVAGMGISMYKIAVDKDVVVKGSPEVDYRYIDKMWDKIL